jgi:hypothetical protein
VSNPELRDGLLVCFIQWQKKWAQDRDIIKTAATSAKAIKPGSADAAKQGASIASNRCQAHQPSKLLKINQIAVAA